MNADAAVVPSTGVAARQLPSAGALNVDHLAHFVPDIDAASADLERLGFTLTPFSPQSHRLEADGPLVPAGTGNRCVMLEHGYLEFLTPTAETPIATQLRSAIARYTGVHLIAFGTATPQEDYARLAAGGFEPLRPVALQRPIGTESGEAIARFTVIRVPPGTMPEGRIQFCRQETPGLLWQKRWIAHRNGAAALRKIVLCVSDPEDTARRYSRFTGLTSKQLGRTWTLTTERGTLIFTDRDDTERKFGLQPPALPWIAGYSLTVRDVASTRDSVRSTGLQTHELGERRFSVLLPASLGGVLIFEAADSADLEL